MKPKRMFLMLLLILMGAMGVKAQSIVAVGNQITSEDGISENTPYILKTGADRYITDNGTNFDVPNAANSATEASVYYFISNGDGTWKIKNYYTNHYWGVPVYNTALTSVEESSAGAWALNFSSGIAYPTASDANGTTRGIDRSSGKVWSWSTGDNNNHKVYIYEILEDNFSPTASEVYTINNTNSYRGALTYDPSQSTLWIWSSGKSGATAFDANSVNCQWVLYPTGDEGQYYLYNVGAQKFAVVRSDGNYGTTWAFSNNAVAIMLEPQTNGTYFIKSAVGNTYMSVSNSYTGPVITYYANGDGGLPFTITKVDGDKSAEVTAAVNKLIENQTALTAVNSISDGWYAIRIKTHNTYADKFVYHSGTDVTYNSTTYPLTFDHNVNMRPAIDDAMYYVHMKLNNGNFYLQLPDGRYLYGANNKFPIPSYEEQASSTDYSNGFRFWGSNRYAVPYLLGGVYFIGETSSSGNAYYDVYPISLDDAGLTAWKMVCDDAPDATKISCTRSDVSGLTSVYKNGYIFLPSNVTPESSDFNMPGAISSTVDAVAHTVTIDYDPSIAIVAEGVSVYQGYGTTGLGNDKAVLLRIQASPINQMENVVMSFTLTNPNYISNVKVYETGNTVEFNALDSYTATYNGTISDGMATVNLGTVSAGTHYYWLCATVADNAVVGDIIDAALTSITYDYNGYTGTVCDLSAIGNPNNAMKIFDVQQYLFQPTTVGSNYYRIPALITANDGSIIAACDKRYNSSSDLGSHKIDVVMRRSTDGGNTWSNVMDVAVGDGSSDAGYGYGDPSLVMCADGKLICLMAAGKNSFWQGMSNIAMITSTDNGETWTSPVDITTNGTLTNHSDKSDWFVTSGKGLYTSDGVIMFLLDADHSAETNLVLYSTDEGATWHIDANYVATGANEAKLVELESGKLLSSTRNPYSRIFNTGTYTKNNDGTCTFSWGTQTTNSTLSQGGSGNNQDIIVYNRNRDGSAKVLLHTLTTGYGHKTLKLFMSIDMGNTWKEVLEVQPGGSRYAVATILSNEDVGILFEDYSLEAGNEYPINFFTVTKEQILSWYEEMVEEASCLDVKNSVQGSSTGCDAWGSFSNASNGWCTTWTSNDASGQAGVTVVASGYDFNKSTVYSQRCLAIRPSANGATDEITITAPEGFIIDSYTIGGRNYSSSQNYKLIAPDGTEVTTTTGTVNSITVENVNNTTSTFQFYGSSTTNYLCVTNFIIKLKTLYTASLNVVGNASWATLYVPFDLTAIDNTTAYYIDKVEGNEANLIEIADGNVPALTAVVLMNSDAATKATFSVAKNLESVVDERANSLKGTTTPMELDLGDNTPYYSLGRLNGVIGFYKFKSNGSSIITLGANKAYLDTTVPVNSAKGFRLVFNDIDNPNDPIVSDDGGLVDGIKEVHATGKAVVFNLNGVRVNTLCKGVYIMNGKKVVVK